MAGGGRDRDHRRRAAGRSSASTSATPRTRCSGAASCRPEDARPDRGAAGHLRPARRPGRRAQALLPGRRPPALPGPLRPQPVGPRAQDAHGHGRRRVPHHLRPARRRRLAATWDEVRDQLAARFPKIGTLMDAAKTEVLAFTAFPAALAKGLEHQPTRAGQQGDQTPGPGRRHLPQRPPPAAGARWRASSTPAWPPRAGVFTPICLRWPGI